MAEIISTPLVYPRFDEHEQIEVQPETESIQGRTIFHLFIHTHIRKQFKGTWYLIPVLMRNDNILFPDKYIEQQKAQFRREIEVQFHTECYKTLLFYEIENSIRMQILPYGRPPIFQDADQRSEKERLGINIK
jgi:hypothetical protein